MKKLWVIGGVVLVLIGLGGIASYGFRTDGDLEPVEKTWSFRANELNNLKIKSDYNVDITFVRSTDGNNTISLNGEGTEKMVADTLVTEIENGALLLDLRKKPDRWFEFFNIDAFRGKETITIALTEEARWDALDLDLDSGNVTIKDAELATIGRASIDIDSGNVTLDRFKSEQLEVDIDSGNVTANGLTATVKASADSGNVRLNDLSGAANVEVDSGNIRLYKLTNDEAVLEADSGNVYVQVPADFGGFYDLKADSGSVSAPESKRLTTDLIKVRTDSGNIKIEQK